MHTKEFTLGQELYKGFVLDQADLGPIHWYHTAKKAAVVLSVDDVFPGTSHSAYEAGGDLEKGALGHLLWLLERHPNVKITLFVTPDWRQISPVAHRLWRHVPWLRDRVWLVDVLPKGIMDVRRHPKFVAFLNEMPRTEIALHGLHHVHPGRKPSVEFQWQDRTTCVALLDEAIRIFNESGLRWTRGLQPPGWNCPPALVAACHDVGIEWITSARDIRTPVSKRAKTAMSGLSGVSMIFPERITPHLLHISTNFQATSPLERAFQVIDAGGVLSIKAHITKNVPGHSHLDGVDGVYMNYLDRLFDEIEDRYGNAIFWTTIGELAALLSSPTLVKTESAIPTSALHPEPNIRLVSPPECPSHAGAASSRNARIIHDAAHVLQ